MTRRTVQTADGRTVKLGTRTAGAAFGTVGVVLSVDSGRVLAESAWVRPYGYVEMALMDAQVVASQMGGTR